MSNETEKLNELNETADLNEIAKKIDDGTLIKDKLDILKEITEDMNNKLISMDTVIVTQTRIVEVLTKENAEEFKDLIEETNRQIENLKEQKPLLTQKREALLEVIKHMEDNTELHTDVNTLLYVFGLFE